MDIIFPLILGMMLLIAYTAAKSLSGGRVDMTTVVALLMGLVIIVVMLPVVMSPSFGLNESSIFDNIIVYGGGTHSNCVQYRTVDCEVYNIPTETCNVTITEEGPFYDKRKVKSYSKSICVGWENGTVIK